jgi:hypothetical protein
VIDCTDIDLDLKQLGKDVEGEKEEGDDDDEEKVSYSVLFVQEALASRLKGLLGPIRAFKG